MRRTSVREAFERWLSRSEGCSRDWIRQQTDGFGGYENPRWDLAWESWQACRKHARRSPSPRGSL